MQRNQPDQLANPQGHSGVKRLFSVKDFKANLLKFSQINVQLLQIDFIEHDPSGLYKPRGQRLTNRETIKLFNL